MLGPFKSCGRKRVFVAVGHGPWGITLAPGAFLWFFLLDIPQS